MKIKPFVTDYLTRLKLILDNIDSEVISDIVNGYWIHQQYYFYTKKEAIKLFRKFRKEKQNERHN